MLEGRKLDEKRGGTKRLNQDKKHKRPEKINEFFRKNSQDCCAAWTWRPKEGKKGRKRETESHESEVFKQPPPPPKKSPYPSTPRKIKGQKCPGGKKRGDERKSGVHWRGKVRRIRDRPWPATAKKILKKT